MHLFGSRLRLVFLYQLLIWPKVFTDLWIWIWDRKHITNFVLFKSSTDFYIYWLWYLGQSIYWLFIHISYWLLDHWLLIGNTLLAFIYWLFAALTFDFFYQLLFWSFCEIFYWLLFDAEELTFIRAIILLTFSFTDFEIFYWLWKSPTNFYLAPFLLLTFIWKVLLTFILPTDFYWLFIWSSNFYFTDLLTFDLPTFCLVTFHTDFLFAVLTFHLSN